MDILKKDLAPISSEAWGEINSEAQKVLNNVLSARKFVEVSGPHGWDYGAHSLGRLENLQKEGNVNYGTNQVQPLIEARVPFELNIWELDNIIRGEDNIDLDPLRDAAKEIARFEENIVYGGHKQANIAGLQNSSDHNPISFPEKTEDWLKTVAEGINTFNCAGVGGPYSLVLSQEKWSDILAYIKGGQPLQNIIKNATGGSIIVSPFLKEEGYLVAEQEDNCQLTLGSDLAIGYESHNTKTVQLFITESFTFRVIDPATVIVIQ